MASRWRKICSISIITSVCGCMLGHFSQVLLFATICMIACQAPLSMAFSMQEHWSGLPCPLPEGLPDPRIKLSYPTSPALQANSLPSEPPEKPLQGKERFINSSWVAFFQFVHLGQRRMKLSHRGKNGDKRWRKNIVWFSKSSLAAGSLFSHVTQ